MESFVFPLTGISLRQPRLVAVLSFVALSACTLAPVPSATPTYAVTSTAAITQTPSATPTSTKTPLPSPTLPSITAICTPLADHELARITDYISTPFTEPIGSNRETGHHGIDFSYYRKDGVGPPIDGTPIQSMLEGRVVGLGFDRPPYGYMMVVESPFDNLPSALAALYSMQPGMSLYLLYGHMLEAPAFSIGDEVSCGQVLGQVGNTGFSGNPHLHLETRVGPTGIILPTMAFYETTATLEEQEAYRLWRISGTFALHSPLLLLNYPFPDTGE